MSNHMLVSSPGGNMKAMYQCHGVSFKIMGRDFCANFIVLDSSRIDVILGMGWLSKVDAVIQCVKRSVLLTSRDGEQFEFVATLSSAADCAVNQLKAGPPISLHSRVHSVRNIIVMHMTRYITTTKWK
jgi:hypothetical protein